MKAGDKVKISIADSLDAELKSLAHQTGPKINGVVYYITGNLVAVKTAQGQINARSQDVIAA